MHSKGDPIILIPAICSPSITPTLGGYTLVYMNIVAVIILQNEVFVHGQKNKNVNQKYNHMSYYTQKREDGQSKSLPFSGSQFLRPL